MWIQVEEEKENRSCKAASWEIKEEDPAGAIWALAFLGKTRHIPAPRHMISKELKARVSGSPGKCRK